MNLSTEKSKVNSCLKLKNTGLGIYQGHEIATLNLGTSIPKIDTYEKGITAAMEAADPAVIAAFLSQQHQRYAESLLESG
jgi:hypothetical protein